MVSRSSLPIPTQPTFILTYTEISALSDLPLIKPFQASLVSKTISVAYFYTEKKKREIVNLSVTRHLGNNMQLTLFLASPLKANTFSGLPSGIL
jgi:hypothetical protein